MRKLPCSEEMCFFQNHPKVNVSDPKLLCSLNHAVLLRTFDTPLFQFLFLLPWCLKKILLMRYFLLAVLPCGNNFYLESEHWEKITKQEPHRSSADDSKGFRGAGMENSGNKDKASLKSYTAIYTWLS